MITGLDHINIETTDLDGTIRFYEEVLGLRNGTRPPFTFPGAWLYSGEQAVVHLVGVDDPAGTSTGPINHVALLANNFTACKARLDEQAQPYEQRMVPDSNIRQLFVNDPNGVRLELNFHGD
ncbi:MAG: glyoxalase [Deltaproteobacteria bacterium]|nr:glyoxalase [Deltaproteobacteria bacterium]MDP7629271.1 VOC family protein [SAR324 cluster bacterium]